MDTIVFNKEKFFQGFLNNKYKIENAGFNILHDTAFLTKLLPHDKTCSIVGIKSDKFLIKNRGFVEKAVSFFGENFNHLPEIYRNDKTIATLALKEGKFTGLRLGDTLNNDHEFAYDAVNIDGNILKCFSPGIRDNKDLNILAVERSPLSFRYLLEKMKRDDDIINVALDKEGFVYHFIDPKDRQKETYLVKALKNSNGYAEVIYRDAPVELREKSDISLYACKKNLECIKSVPYKAFFEQGFQEGLHELIEDRREEYIDNTKNGDESAEVFDKYIDKLLTESIDRCNTEQQLALQEKSLEDFLKTSYSEGENIVE